jgi:hypothetical protein
MRGQLLGKTRSALMLLVFATAHAHFSAHAQTRPPTCPPTCALPSPSGQHPTLLASYAVRPPWKVAGVDFAVGVPSTMTLTDWHLLRGPGITVNATAVPPYVRVDNTSNVVIAGVDFSLHGGASLFFVNSPNPTVIASNFGGTNLTKTYNAVVWADAQSPNFTVKFCTIDGAGAGLLSTLVHARGSGTTTLEFNWLKNSPQHVLEEAQSDGVTSAIVYRFNLIEQIGLTPGAHPNFLQSSHPTVTSAVIEFNTTYQTPHSPTPSGEGFQFGGISGKTSNVTFAYNTMIATGGGPGSAMSYLAHAGGFDNPNSVMYGNFMDTTAAYGAFYPGSFGGWTVSNNYLMTSGALLSTTP